jgi:hypothetical protein
MRSWRSIAEYVVLGLLATLGLALIEAFNLAKVNCHQHFVWLAESFRNGRLDIPFKLVADYGTIVDFTVRNGRIFWPLGPLPAVLFVPFMFVDGVATFFQAGAAFAVAYLAYRFARVEGFPAVDAGWLTIAFVLGSEMIGPLLLVGPWSLAHLLTAALFLSAFIERRTADRPWVIGAGLALAAATRLTSLLGAPFFFLIAILGKRPAADKIRYLAAMAAPLIVVLVLLGAYNQARFGSPFDSGYGDSILNPSSFEYQNRAAHGLFNVVNIPRNTYYYFFKPPLTGPAGGIDSRGFSFFLLSPLFLLALWPRKRPSGEWSAAMLTIGAQLLLFLSYYTPGAYQFGPRFMSEVLPFLFLVLLGTLKESSRLGRLKPLIAVSSAVNMAMLLIFVSVT